MKRILLIFAVAATAILAFGCKKEVIEDKITLSTDKEVNASWEGQSFDVVFTSNVDWTASAKADSGSEFFSLDKTSGTAGTATLKLTVQKNEDVSGRSGKVTITAGTASETITVKQEAVGETSEDATITVDFLAKSFDYPVSAKPDKVETAADWIKVSEIKDKAVSLTLTQNDGTAAREGKVSIVIVKHTINLTVVQEPESGELKSPAVSYLGNKAHVYDGENGYSTFGQYKLAFDSEYGKVVLVVTKNPGLDESGNPIAVDGTAIPTGTYAVDGGASYADNTFTIAGVDYTYFTIGEDIYQVIDGEIVIEDGSVKATLVDEFEKMHIFTYTGSLGSVVKDSFGGQYLNEGSYSYYGDYFTYFASPGIYRWDITIVYSDAPSDDAEYMSFITYSIYSSSSSEVPTGNFTYAEPEADPSISGNGNMKAADGTFTMSGNSYGWSYEDRHSFRLNGSPTLSITKEADGRYTFAVTSNMTTYLSITDPETWVTTYEDLATFDWNPTVTVTIDEVSQGSMAYPDLDEFVLDRVGFNPNYSGMYFGDVYGLGGNNNGYVIAFSYLNDNMTVYLTYNADQEYTFERTTPFPYGTYTFSETAGPGTLLPTQYCYIQNSYTGTKAMINGGSFTLNADSVTFDLTAMVLATGKVHKLTGTVRGVGFGGATNRSTSASWLARVAITPVVGPGQ